MRLIGAAVVGLLLCQPKIDLRAQECPDSSPPISGALGRTYAPVLYFAPGERYFPTLPFFGAFDTVGGTRGLLDKTRIIPTTGDGKPASSGDTLAPQVSFDAMDSVYKTRVHESQPLLYLPEASAVFYRVRCVRGKENKQLWGFLKNDPQAWHRTGLDSLFKCGLRDAQFSLVEYWLYYVRDAGLEGHPHDLERIDVFLPRGYKTGKEPDPGSGRERKSGRQARSAWSDS